jgi:hypothetical protein
MRKAASSNVWCARGEGQGKARVVRYRRALVILASAGLNSVPVIARLVQTSEDRVREVIHNFNKMGWTAWTPSGRVGGRPRRITSDDEDFIVETAKARPEKTGSPVHPLEYPQAGGLSGRQPRTQGGDRAATASGDPGQAGDHVPEDQNVEGVQCGFEGRRVLVEWEAESQLDLPSTNPDVFDDEA